MNKYKSFLSLCLISVVFSSCGPNPKKIEEAELHFQSSRTLYAKGETIQSLSEAIKAESADPKNAEVQNFLGLLYAERGDQEKSTSYFLRAVKLKDDYSEAHNNLCAFYLQDEKLDDAIKHCKKAIENVTYSTPERAYSNMAMAYEKKGDLAQAVEMHQKALIHNKKFVFSLLYLGKMSYDKMDYNKARDYLQSADEACSASVKGSWGTSCPEAQYRLALTYLKLKQTPMAVTAFQNCVNSDPTTTNEYKTKCGKSLQVYK